MLGSLIESLEKPEIAARVIAALEDTALSERLSMAAKAAGLPAGEIAAEALRSFLETASDDHWVQLIGIMNRAEDPSLAALRAILAKALPEKDP